MAFVMCCWKLKQAEFSNAELDRAKGATAKPDHLYKEEAKGEKNSNYFLWQEKRKEN